EGGRSATDESQPYPWRRFQLRQPRRAVNPGSLGEDAVKLESIVGYRLDMARWAALRRIHPLLDDTGFRTAGTTAQLLTRPRPGRDQSELGRALAGNRSVGMKVASRLEKRGLLIRGEGRNRR